MKKLSVAVLVLGGLMLLAACGPSAVPSGPAPSSDAFLPAQEGMSGQIHVVQAGDTLYGLGRLYGVSWQDIATANGIVPPYIIYVGEGLLIPGPALAEPPSLLSVVDEGAMGFDPSQSQPPASPGADWYPADVVSEPEYPIDMGGDVIIAEEAVPGVTQITVVIEEPEPAPAAGAQECLGLGEPLWIQTGWTPSGALSMKAAERVVQIGQWCYTANPPVWGYDGGSESFFYIVANSNGDYFFTQIPPSPAQP